MEDAARLRLRISECFERAALPQTTPEVRSAAACACCCRALLPCTAAAAAAAGQRGSMQAGARPACPCGPRTHNPAAPPCPFCLFQERKKLLSFVIVGGGPTGVEVAAELHDLITEDLVKLYPEQVVN